VQLTKYGHACVRITEGDRVLVIDPGTLSEAAALDGATAVLITHEHADHIDTAKLAAARERDPGLAVFTHPELAAAGGASPVAVGDTFTAAGFTVRVVGGAHAEIIDGLPGCPNIGFVVDGLYHPGDSLFVPDFAVDTLLVPASGPWLKLGEAIEFVRAVGPARVFPIHDALLSQIGLEMFDGWVGSKGGASYARLASGESVSL
jgi:L-ascorbate metabolism protein UlaG (beta-lactamase superfamily)